MGQHKKTKIIKAAIIVALTIAIIVLFYIAMLLGLNEFFDAADFEIRRLFLVTEALTDAQAAWVIIGGAMLIFFLVLLIILLVTLFRRYRITEKRALEASIREHALMKENEVLDSLNRTKTEFFHNMSHDFKTPLTVVSTSILNALDLLDYDVDMDEMEESLKPAQSEIMIMSGKEEIRESLKLAQSEIMRMSRIVDNALKNAVLHENKQGNEEIDITLLMQRIAETYRFFVNRRGSTLSLSIPDALPTVYSNTDSLLNIFSNLISNANRHTRNGKITIHAEAIKKKSEEKGEQEFVSITVSDTGTGIKPEILPVVFERGVSESGTGIGLHICKIAVEAHGGTINARSVNSEGTDITFTVPVYNDSNLQ